MVDSRQFLLNTDYPIDNIVFLAEGSFSSPVGFGNTITIASHGLSFTPLPMLVWSNDADFTVSNTFFDTALASTFFSGGIGQQYLPYATSSDIVIQADNSTGSTQTVYYRVYCFPPSDIPDDAIVPATANEGDSFTFNTDYNYLKMIRSGKLTTSAPTYDHNLGYVPRVLKWGILTGVYATPIVAPNFASSDTTGSAGFTTGVYATTSSIGWMNPNTFDEIEYRLYGDS